MSSEDSKNHLDKVVRALLDTVALVGMSSIAAFAGNSLFTIVFDQTDQYICTDTILTTVISNSAGISIPYHVALAVQSMKVNM